MNRVAGTHKKVRSVSLIVIFLYIAMSSYFGPVMKVESAAGSPEASLYNLSGDESSTFRINEEAYLNLRLKSDRIPGYREKLDIVIALDGSGSMGRPITIDGQETTKIARGKEFTRSFINQIGVDDDVNLSVYSFNWNVNTGSSVYRGLSPINSEDIKADYISAVDNWASAGGTDVNKAAVHANKILGSGREDATKYIILVTDGGEHPHNLMDDDGNVIDSDYTGYNSEASPSDWWGRFINYYDFYEEWVNNMDAEVADGSTLEDSISKNIKYLSIYINPNGDTNDLSIPNDIPPYPGIMYGNAGLMRFIAAKSNGVTLSGNIDAWNDDFTQEPTIDNKYMYLFYNDNISDIYQYIRGSDGVYLDDYLKLAHQASLQEIEYSRDKGGNTRSVSLTDMSDNLYKIETDETLPVDYMCAQGDQLCRENATLRSDGNYWIEDNYLDIRIKIKFNLPGKFDLLSNYRGCDVGSPERIATQSKLELIDPRTNESYETLDFDSLCTEVKDRNLNVAIEKRVYNCELNSDGSSCNSDDGRSVEKSTFEPGDVAAVSIKVNSSSNYTNVDFDLRDYLPEEAVLPVELTSSADRNRYCHLDTSKEFMTGLSGVSGYAEWRDLSATKSDKYICYKYGVGEGAGDAKNKNNVRQIDAIAYTAGGGFDNVVGISNNYLMVRGYPFIQSLQDPNRLDVAKPFSITKIEDELAFAFTKSISQDNEVFTSVPSYVYIRGSGEKSRGGTLVSLPVKMTDTSETKTFFSDQFYILYNPLFYLFGNMFSGSTSSSTAFDFGHGSSAISNSPVGSDKLNSASSLYNYHFDQNSVLYWDRSNRDKNKAMDENISRIIGSSGSRPDNFCELGGGAGLEQETNSNVYLNNKNCNVGSIDNSNIWPSGRVWYVRPVSDINISSKIVKGGTLVVDFADAPGIPSVNISTKANDFTSDSYLGLIVINGGQVVFTKEAEEYKGVVFVPGRSDDNPSQTDQEGRIIFAEDGQPLTIRGSIIADEIDFNKREKNQNNYAVSIYSDFSLINSRIPGFEKLMNAILD